MDYNREKAVAYARKYALTRNPRYTNFHDMGGDCTNFVSQCLYAGGCRMNYTPDFGWFYIDIHRRSAAWTGVEYLYKFLTRTWRGVGPLAELTDLAGLEIGDVISLRFSKEHFEHSLIVTEITGPPVPKNILVCTHTYDALDRPLSSYYYSELRCMHILGNMLM